jgi:hypothetical protein
MLKDEAEGLAATTKTPSPSLFDTMEEVALRPSGTAWPVFVGVAMAMVLGAYIATRGLVEERLAVVA